MQHDIPGHNLILETLLSYFIPFSLKFTSVDLWTKTMPFSRHWSEISWWRNGYIFPM